MSVKQLFIAFYSGLKMAQQLFTWLPRLGTWTVPWPCLAVELIRSSPQLMELCRSTWLVLPAIRLLLFLPSSFLQLHQLY